MNGTGKAGEPQSCCVCGEDIVVCECSVPELREMLNGLGNILVEFAKLVAGYSPAAINVAHTIVAQYEKDQEEMKNE